MKLVSSETRDAQLGKLEEKKRKAVAELEVEEQILKLLPEGLRLPTYVHAGGYCTDGSIAFEAEHDEMFTRADALQIVERLPLQVAIKVKSPSFTNIVPAERIPKEYRREGTDGILLEGPWFEIEMLGVSELTVHWFTKLGPFLLDVTARRLRGHYTEHPMIVENHIRGNGDRIIQHRWKLQLPKWAEGWESMQYSSGEHTKPGRFVLYKPKGDYSMPWDEE